MSTCHAIEEKREAPYNETMTRVMVGSTNPVKIEAARDAFRAYFSDARAEGIAVPSGVPDQPVGEATFEGARNRADALYRKHESEALGGDFFVGIEGGVIQHVGRWFAFGAVCVMDACGRMGFGASPLFELPAGVAEALRAGEELGHVIDRLSGQSNSKQQGGAIGHFTRGAVDRKAIYAQGTVVALVPFLNEALFFPPA